MKKKLTAENAKVYAQSCHFDEGEITLGIRQRLAILIAEFLV